MSFVVLAISALTGIIAFDEGLSLAAEAGGAMVKLKDLSISPECQNAANALQSSSVSQCLNVDGLSDVIQPPQNVSWIDSVDTWLKGTCSEPACNPKEVAVAFDSIMSGCQDEFKQLRVTEDHIEGIQSQIAKYYPLGRELLCLGRKTSPDGPMSLCPTKTLNSLEAFVGEPLNTRSVAENWRAFFNATDSGALGCDPCTRGYHKILSKYGAIGGVQNWLATKLWNKQCDSELQMVSRPLYQLLHKIEEIPSNDGASKSSTSTFVPALWPSLAVSFLGTAVLLF